MSLVKDDYYSKADELARADAGLPRSGYPPFRPNTSPAHGCTAQGAAMPAALKAELMDAARKERAQFAVGLPSDDAARKALPIWTGFVMYFPDVFAAIAEVSKKGNDQHNPGEPLHWAREKSTDQMNTAFRHMLDHARGNRFDTDKSRHLAKAIWRLCAELQLDIEKGDRV